MPLRYPFQRTQPLSARVHFVLEGPNTYRSGISFINEALASPGTLMTLILPRTLVAFMSLVCKNIVCKNVYLYAKQYWPNPVHKVLTIPDKFIEVKTGESYIVSANIHEQIKYHAKNNTLQHLLVLRPIGH